MVRLLLVEDDPTMRATLADHLTRCGHEVESVPDGAAALTAYVARPPDLVLLDLMLPVLDGMEAARRLRSMRADLPIIMVTARAQEHERVAGLALGADDYVTKPFSLRELDLRIRAVLRRVDGQTPAPAQPVLQDGDLRVDLAARTVTRGGAAIPLTAREFDLLAWLVRHPGRTWTRDELLREVWGWTIGDASTVTVHVRRLREKVEADPGMPGRLVTVFGRGYRWDSS